MKHLSRDELVDVADGTRAAESVPHLRGCAVCQGEVERLQAMMARVADVEAPEPSPLFWEHLSARVSAAVAAEHGARRAAWHDRLVARILVAAAAAAAALLLGATLLRTPSDAVGVPVPRTADAAAPSEAVEGTAMIPPDDPALDVVADMGAELNWNEIHDSGIVAHSGLVDRAVSGLSAGERAELGKMLKVELAGGSN